MQKYLSRIHIQFHKKTILFVLTNIFGKCLAAFAQLYAIFVFTSTQTEDNAAIIFLLLGYAIWFQVFELGLSQTLQNKFNSRIMSAHDILKVILIHYAFLVVIAILIIYDPFFSEILLSTERAKSNPSGVNAFSIGAAILILASSNSILQRFLLIINKGLLGNSLITIQSLMVILFLSIYQLCDQTSLIFAVFLYLGPQILVPVPLLIKFISKLLKSKHTKPMAGKKFLGLFGFLGAGVLSAIFLGSDYYFAAHYLSSTEIISYYLVTRVFFIAYVVYFAFLQYRSKKLSTMHLIIDSKEVAHVVKESCLVGLAAVSATYGIASICEVAGIFKLMTHGAGASQALLFMGFIYFIVRVFRDVALVVIGNLDAKVILYQIYIIEVILSLILMCLLTSMYGAFGIFLSLISACLAGLVFSLLRRCSLSK